MCLFQIWGLSCHRKQTTPHDSFSLLSRHLSYVAKPNTDLKHHKLKNGKKFLRHTELYIWLHENYLNKIPERIFQVSWGGSFLLAQVKPHCRTRRDGFRDSKGMSLSLKAPSCCQGSSESSSSLGSEANRWGRSFLLMWKPSLNWRWCFHGNCITLQSETPQRVA